MTDIKNIQVGIVLTEEAYEVLKQDRRPNQTIAAYARELLESANPRLKAANDKLHGRGKYPRTEKHRKAAAELKPVTTNKTATAPRREVKHSEKSLAELRHEAELEILIREGAVLP